MPAVKKCNTVPVCKVNFREEYVFRCLIVCFNLLEKRNAMVLCFFPALPGNWFMELKLPIIYDIGKYRLSAVKVEYLLELKTYQTNFLISNNRLRRSMISVKKSEITNFAAIFLYIFLFTIHILNCYFFRKNAVTEESTAEKVDLLPKRTIFTLL